MYTCYWSCTARSFYSVKIFKFFLYFLKIYKLKLLNKPVKNHMKFTTFATTTKQWYRIHLSIGLFLAELGYTLTSKY